MKENNEFIGVDEKFVPEEEKNVKDTVAKDKGENKSNNTATKALKIGLGAVAIWILVLISIAVIGIVAYFNYSRKMGEKVLDVFNDAASQIIEEIPQIDNSDSDVEEQMENAMDIYNDAASQIMEETPEIDNSDSDVEEQMQNAMDMMNSIINN